MKKLFSGATDLGFVFLLSLLLVVPQTAFAQNHVVSSADLQHAISSASAARRQDISRLDNLFRSVQARQALKSAHIDYRQVTNAVPQLNDKDLARLANLSAKSQNEFAAGQLTNRDLLWILVAVAALILIIVAVRD